MAEDARFIAATSFFLQYTARSIQKSEKPVGKQKKIAAMGLVWYSFVRNT
jgi:hypothetical protein